MCQLRVALFQGLLTVQFWIIFAHNQNCRPGNKAGSCSSNLSVGPPKVHVKLYMASVYTSYINSKTVKAFV